MSQRSATPRSHHGRRLACTLLICLGVALCTPAKVNVQAAPQQQEPSKAADNSQQESNGEMAVKDEASSSTVSEATKFRVNVHLVLARVVVRDQSGQPVGTLHKEDFEIFDNGRPQVISDFDVEHAEPVPAAATATSTPTDSAQPSVKLEFPVRFVAYLFDDVHLSFQDLASVRAAAQRRLDSLAPSDRAAIFSTSGQTVLDFTDDRVKLHETLNKLQPRPISGGAGIDPCPRISFYQADQIVNKKNPDALQTAINDYIYCANLPQQMVTSVGPEIEGMAAGVLSTGEHESRLALGMIHDTIRRIVGMPGQRSIILVSPGFLTPDLEYEYYDLVDQALRAQVVINSLDARGLYAPVPGGDASSAGQADRTIKGQPNPTTPHVVLDLQEASVQQEILSVLAYGTGGNFFRDNNDMNEGLRRLAESPEYYYILGFTPQNLKTDGKFHNLKVTLKSRQKYDVQARSGYYAPRKLEDPAEAAKREIQDEVLSSEVLHDLPVALHTQFFKASDDSAKLTVMARIDVKRLHYKHAADNRNQNELTIVTAVFDRNGNMLQANEKLVEMRWKTETLQTKLASGITLKSSFDVKPGRYMVRVVARDTEQQVMSAENGAVEIP